jgi:hypothetical protein
VCVLFNWCDAAVERAGGDYCAAVKIIAAVAAIGKGRSCYALCVGEWYSAVV